MRGAPLCSNPIDMTGYRSLVVEARLPEEPEAGHGGMSLRVSGTSDGKASKKTWTAKGAAIALHAGESVVARFEDLGRFARVEAEGQPGFGKGRLVVRLIREP